MKRIILLFFAAFIGLNAQTTYTTFPQSPTVFDSLEITFDVTNTTRNLAGYSGQVYAHTGVSVENASGGIDRWQHVIEGWGNDNTQPKLTRVSTNIYKLIIPDLREFYSIPVSVDLSDVKEICIVLRSANTTGDYQQTEDLFITLFGAGITVLVNNPSFAVDYVADENNPFIMSRASSLQFEASAAAVGTEVDSMFFWIGNSLIKSASGDKLTHYLVGSSSPVGLNLSHVIAKDTAGIADTMSFYMLITPTPVSASLPQGIEAGINYTSDNSVTLALEAPGKQRVYVVGDFNNWQLNDDYYMKRTPDGKIFWLEITGLTPGEEYAFQYLVDGYGGTVRIADPYTEKILHWDDSWISNSTYSNLKDYPFDSNQFAVSVLQTGKQEYQWEVTDFTPPAKDEMVIYELHIRDWVQNHDYKSLIDSIGYFERLGVNVIELMPINEFEGNESWGYNPAFYFAPDKYYGPENDLKKFIDECHKRDIAVFIDLVLNHSFGQSPLVRMYAEGNYGPAANDNPWYNSVCPHSFCWGEDFNHASQYTKDFIDRVNRHWIEEFNVDGYRYDYTRGFTNSDNGYDQNRINNLKRMADEIWSYDSDFTIILEHWCDNAEEKILTDYGMMVWANVTHAYQEGAMGYNESSKSDFSGASYKARGFTKPHIVSYMESHDEERIMYKNKLYGNSSGNYNTKDPSTRLDRMALAATFFFPIPGPKMIWQFGELGYDVSINMNINEELPPSNWDEDAYRTDRKPIKWQYYQDPDRRDLFNVFRQLIHLKKNYDVFKTTDYGMNASGALKTIHLAHSSMDVTILGNFGVTEANITPYFQQTGKWYEYFTGDSISVSDPTSWILLSPGEYRLYTSVKIDNPYIVTGVSDGNKNNLPTETKLLANYPNPFNPSTTISYTLNKSSFVKMNIYNSLGQLVRKLVSEENTAGSYSVIWDGKNNFGKEMSSGIYIVSMTGQNFNFSQKIM
ncbi:MAG: T9SS type A sorting domain-containing protein, partial [Melioribacteraceae bacterium]|nr:T9SS type A sorting domain-containing protein [Melioribacteraceae bacterium]